MLTITIKHIKCFSITIYICNKHCCLW